jgi:hypothetical protein
MLINPYEERLVTYEGTRLLKETYGIVGEGVRSVADPQRLWVIQGLYAPVPQRALGGIRARLTDNRGFVTFINQRDLEVMIGLGRPGEKCPWLGEPYLSQFSKDWCGFCMDRDDLLDDLMERELFLRCSYPPLSVLPPGTDLTRLLFVEQGHEVKEELVLVWDMNPETGESPDTSVTTIDNRWATTRSVRL